MIADGSRTATIPLGYLHRRIGDGQRDAPGSSGSIP